MQGSIIERLNLSFQFPNIQKNHSTVINQHPTNMKYISNQLQPISFIPYHHSITNFPMEIGSSYEVQGVAPGRERTLFSAHKKRPVLASVGESPKLPTWDVGDWHKVVEITGIPCGCHDMTA